MIVPVESLTSHEARKELKSLNSEIARHNELYHGNDKPEISDGDFDALTRRKTAIETQFPFLAGASPVDVKVGAAPRREFSKIVHARPMLSLDNCFTADDVSDFISSIRKFLNLPDTAELEFTAEPKIDGLSMSLRYEQGKLVSGATRGDGAEGEDVTANILTVADIPTQLPGHLVVPDVVEVRGEVYMSKTEFFRINAELEAAGKELYANPRNTAAGSLRQLDAKITANRKLNFFAYAWGEMSNMPADTQEGMIEFFRACGFKVNPYTRKLPGSELLTIYERVGTDRASLEYDIDGVVYKINSIDLQERLGFRSRTPRWATAHKYPAEKANTVLESIDIQVGRTGALSPVGRVAPVTVGGVVVSNVTLHNEDYIKGFDADGNPIREGKDLRVGDTVVIYRAGDVIPSIDDVDLDKRPVTALPYRFPTTCPRCGSPAQREADKKGKLLSVTRCTGDLICEAQAIETLCHIVSKQCLDIDGLGEKQIDYFFKDAELPVKNVADIFTIADRDAALGSILKTRPGYKEASVKKLFAAIEERRVIPLDRAIYAMGIRQVGSSTSKAIAKHYETLAAVKSVFERVAEGDPDAIADLTQINDVGDAVASALRSFFSQEGNREIIERFTRLVTIKDAEKAASSSPVSGLTIVFTGSFERMGRDEAKAMGERLGAKVSGSVSKKTDLVVAGDKAGGKLDQAKDLGIKTLNEEEWFALIGG
jgi:DNA ligase (NAD+)